MNALLCNCPCPNQHLTLFMCWWRFFLFQIPMGIDSRSASYELRCEEVETLQAIYGDDVFRCVERDAHWRVRISPSHLIKYTGQGSYLNLDIRIPEGSLYPFEPPTINVSVVNGDPSMKLPTYVFLNLTLRLVQEARQNSLEQIPSVFSLISLLETEEVIAKSVTDPPMKHSLPMPSARETKKTSGDFHICCINLKRFTHLLITAKRQRWLGRDVNEWCHAAKR